MWDTVGTLGVPEMKLFGFLDIFKSEHREYSFVNTEVPSSVEYAYHALALDEQRKPFGPTLWESPKPNQVLKQTWFPGVHSSIGGGYTDTSISDIGLAWIITQLSKHLDFDEVLSFDEKYMVTQQGQNVKFYEDHKVPIARWVSIEMSATVLRLVNPVAATASPIHRFKFIP